MTRTHCPLWLGAGVAITVGIASAARAEIVLNGGFETGNFFGWSVPPNVPPSQPNPQLFFVSSSGTPHSGTYFASLASTQFQYVSQILPTQAGMDYELSYWLRQSPGLGSFRVRWEGDVIFGQLLGSSEAVWTQYIFPVHASITGSLLEFGQAYFPGEFSLDEVSVVIVPAPSAALLLMMGGVVAVRRRRQR